MMHKLDTILEKSRSDYIIIIAFHLELLNSLEMDIKTNNFTFPYSVYTANRWVPFSKKQPQYHHDI